MWFRPDSGRLDQMSHDTAAPTRDGSTRSEAPSGRSRRRSESTLTQRVLLSAVLGVGMAVAVTLGDADPTGGAGIDALIRAVVMASTVLAGTRARRRVLLVAAGLVAIGSDGWMLAPAAVALVLSFVLALTDRRDRVAGGIAGALIAWAALDLSWPASPTGATTLLAAAALVPLWYSAYKVVRSSDRRRIRLGVAITAVTVVVGTIVGVVLALTQRSSLVEAADATVAAAGVIASGDGGGDPAPFIENQQRFASVADAAGSWWAAPAKLVPVVAQNVRALEAAATSGAELNDAAAQIAPTVDYDALSLPDGSIDLARLASYEAPAANAEAAVRDAQRRVSAARSPWLAPPVAAQLDDFLEQLDQGAAATALAAAATRELPGILGADGPRRYLLLLGNPSEARDLGGHLGNWAELTATDGKLDVVRVGEPYELFGPGTERRPQLSPSLELPASLVEVDPTRFPQNWGATPDLDTVAALAADLYPQTDGGAPIDGVLYADPTAFAALLEITGPVDADGRTLSATDAVEFLTRGQYADTAGQERSVTPLIRAALDRFTDNQLPGPTRLAGVFSAAIDAGRLQFVTTGSDGSELLRATSMDQPLDAPEGGDLLAVINRNANPSKIDAYLRRTIDYEISWEPSSGAIRSRVVITLQNDAPAEGLPPVVNGSAAATPPGTNRTEVSVLSRFDALGAMVDGETRAFSSRPDLDDLHRYSLIVDLPPGGQRTVILDLEGEVRAGDIYRLNWYNQPLVNADTSRMIIEPVGAPLADGSDAGSLNIGSARVERIVVAAG